MPELRSTHDIFWKISPKEVFRVSVDGTEGIYLGLGGLETCYINNACINI